jgi:hypothetical protein
VGVLVNVGLGVEGVVEAVGVVVGSLVPAICAVTRRRRACVGSSR